ncbi:MAG: DUF3037 domain-containing protein [Candidatus Korobacteraceae bacterium]
MAAFKQCDFFLLRYVPDVVKGECVNIGVVLLEEGDNGFTGVRFTRDWRRARCADPDLDIELLESYEAELQRLLESRLPEVINYRGRMSRREWLLEQMQQSLSGVFQLDPMAAVFTESPPLELGKLAQTYLESTARAHRVITGRRVIVDAMRNAFEKTGVWQFMRHDIAVAQYTRKGDPLKIDCGYRPNGVLHLFHGLSLATNVDSAKILAYSYSEMREGLLAAEHVPSHLTAITEDELDLHDEGVAFALATLHDNDIEIASVVALPQIAEQARLELKL